jgi:hypothetical protein
MLIFQFPKENNYFKEVGIPGKLQLLLKVVNCRCMVADQSVAITQLGICGHFFCVKVLLFTIIFLHVS